ncbi:MAG TPA: CatB-related O-acetyltransferase [Alphaproteobacteria bacterium]|nr:CatB-related O-acetyltransferase [Alphaproteobacteria bacterium]
MNGPNPLDPHPMAGQPRVMFLKPLIDLPNVEIGDYTYYDDPDGIEGFKRGILYHYPFTGDVLRIGRFCAIATGAKFVMNGGNHRTAGFSTYPFPIFDQGWRGRWEGEFDFPSRGDTIIGNDVWIGHDAMIMPGVTVGDGAIIGTRAVVAADVPPYTVVAGNPARPLRQRFDDATVAALLRIRWWDWDAAKITRNIAAISNADLAALEAAA